MFISDFLFFTFALGAIISALLVISKKNPVHSVFFLVLTFANVSVLLFLLGVEFLAITFWIVYVGAIAILFIFVIKLINIKLVELFDNTTRYLPIGLIIGIVLLWEFNIFYKDYIINNTHDIVEFTYSHIINHTNIEVLGKFLYTDYYIYLIIASLILLVAMIGAIILTLGHEEGIKRQDIFTQITQSSNIKLIN